MALKKEKKIELVKKYSEAIQNSNSIVYVTFKNLPVKDTMELRRSLRSENVKYGVVKKTLWNLAIKNSEIKGEAPVVQTEMAVAWGEDLLAPARIVNEFIKTHKDGMRIMGGIWQGEFKDAKSMMEIATIPPREVLLSKLAFLLKAPIQKLAIGLSEVAKIKN